MESGKLFSLAGLVIDEATALTVKELLTEKTNEYVLKNFTFQDGDIEFLQKLQGELKQPITFGLAYELLKRRR